jgi:hypothetical protein
MSSEVSLLTAKADCLPCLGEGTSKISGFWRLSKLAVVTKENPK